MVDKFLHGHEHALFFRESGFGVAHVDFPFWEVSENLFNYFDGLAHLLHTDEEAVVAITILAHRNIEVVFLVAQIRAILPKVTGHSASAKVGAGHPIAYSVLAADYPDIAHPLEVDLIVVKEPSNFVDSVFTLIKEL